MKRSVNKSLEAENTVFTEYKWQCDVMNDEVREVQNLCCIGWIRYGTAYGPITYGGKGKVLPSSISGSQNIFPPIPNSADVMLMYPRRTILDVRALLSKLVDTVRAKSVANGYQMKNSPFSIEGRRDRADAQDLLLLQQEQRTTKTHIHIIVGW
jgi:hypothetical protein